MSQYNEPIIDTSTVYDDGTRIAELTTFDGEFASLLLTIVDESRMIVFDAEVTNVEEARDFMADEGLDLNDDLTHHYARYHGVCVCCDPR